MKKNIFKYFDKMTLLFVGGIFFVTILLSFVFTYPAHAQSPENEIHYGAVATVQGQNIGIEYRGPSGDLHYDCSLLTNDCKEVSSTGNFFIQNANVGTFELTSKNGKYGLKAFALKGSTGITVFYSLYDISSGTPKFKELVPFNEPAVKKYFTSDSENIIFIGVNGKSTRYNIPSGDLETMTLRGTDLPFLTISPDGNFLSAYDYVENAHTVYDFSTKKDLHISGNVASYLEFGKSDVAAYQNNDGDFDALFAVDLSGLNNGSPSIFPTKITSGNSIIKDYIFVGGHLFYMSNGGHPLRWSIYEYDPQTRETNEVASDVSYGEFLKAQDGELLYQKLDGKNANIFSYDPQTKETHEFEPVGSSPSTDKITRVPLVMESGRYAVLLSPKNDAVSDDHDLFIWLHGGPMREVAIGYHSYLSYGVYDELLDKLAESGASVLKLDYTGSSGHGRALLNGLHGKVGVVDVADIVSAVKEITQKDDFDHVYLIGNSYGGYLSLKTLVDHPSLFDGAISISPVTDWYGLITRIPSSPFTVLFNGTPNLSNLAAYKNASIDGEIPSLPHSKKILLEYGEKDTEVPTWQSTDFIHFVKQFDNVDLDTIVFPDEGHIIKNRSNLDALCDRIVTDFELSDVSCGRP